MKHFIKVLFGVIHEFEVDPVEQYRFHLFMTWMWLFSMLAVTQVHAFDQNTAALMIMEVSLWANFASHFTAVGSSLAGVIGAHRQDELHSGPLQGLLGFIWRKKIKSAAFTNPNYERAFITPDLMDTIDLHAPDKPFNFDSETDPFGRDDTDDVSSEPYSPGEAHF